MAYVDLHLHLLPGVDDGPADEAASLAHARRLVAAGVAEATVTPHVGHPHFPLDVWTIAERTRALKDLLHGEGLPLRLHPGGEVHPTVAGSISRDELDLVAHGPPGRRWILLEVPFAGVDEAFLSGCARVRHLGFGLVIGHPERAARFAHEGLRLLRPQLVLGAVLQVNVCSLLGRHGGEVESVARRLVRTGLAYVLASDGHGGSRSQTLGEAKALVLDADASAVRAWQLTSANPALLLRDGLDAGVRPPRVRAGPPARPRARPGSR